MSKLSPQAVRNVQRILDDIARRRLEERDRDAVGLFDGTDEGFPFSAFDSANANKSDRCHCFNYRWCSRWVENTVGGVA